MFLPSKIEKIRIVLPKRYYDDAVTLIGELGFIQVEALENDAKKITKEYKELDYETINRHGQRIRSLKNNPIKQKTKRIDFKDLNKVYKEANKIKIYEEVNEIKKKEDSLNAEIADSESTISILDRIKDFKYDLKILNGERIESFLLEINKKEIEDFLKKMSEAVDFEYVLLQSVVIISVEKHNKEKFAGVANKLDVNAVKIPVLKGNTAAAIKFQQERHLKAVQEKARLTKRIEELSKKYYGIVEALDEYLDIEVKKASLLPKMGATDYVTVTEGWIESKKIIELENEIRNLTSDMYLIEKLETKEEVPTKMANPVSFRLYEFFIKFYSIPKSNEIDPTIFFGIAFPIFFGLMVGDAGYGAFFLILALWLVHRIDHPPKISRIPRKLAKFINTIVSKHALKMIMKAIIPGSIIAIVLGVMFNGYFGFSLPYTPLFNVTKRVATLLLISGWIGVFMVSFGFVLGALNKLYLRKIKLMFGRIGWLLVAWGIVIVGLAVLHKQNIGLSNLSAVISYALIIIGIATVLKTEGVQSLMEVPSVISHILSYTRLVGILLASVILAEVINLIFISTLSGSVFIIAAGVVLLVFGQLFNIVIALFEGGIQGARLIYVEFFSKFYEGNGNLFKPFKIERRNTQNKYVKAEK